MGLPVDVALLEVPGHVELEARQRLQLEQGRPDAALRRYYECADLLHREFNRLPGQETERVLGAAGVGVLVTTLVLTRSRAGWGVAVHRGAGTIGHVAAGPSVDRYR